MRLAKCIKCASFVTILALLFIHMQMQIIDLAYQGKEREGHIRELIEENGHITYTVLTLTSSNHLGGTMLSEESQMDFADPNNIMEISAGNEYFPGELEIVGNGKKKSNFLVSLLSFGTQAEARPQETKTIRP